VGITDHAQAELTDVVFVDLPKVGAEVTAGQQACVVESVKAASDIYSPATGTIVAVNEALSSNPALINTDPYGEGWIFKVKLSSPDGSDALKSPADYRAQVG
jgi:glycine cleavage system H protein